MSPRYLRTSSLLGLLCAGLLACGGSSTPAADGGASGDGGAAAADGGASADGGAGADGGTSADGGLREVTCIDESIQQLPLFEAASSRALTAESVDGGVGNYVHVDATGGGLTPTESFVYARFTDTGLVKVDVGDEASLASLDWHIAFRRFLIRLNSGVGGPGDVTAARTAAGTTFANLASEPANLSYRTEQYFTESCELVTDTSGLGSPATALSSFWSYSGCVAMTGNVYVLSLPGDKRVKLEVLSYYSPENQVRCQSMGSTSTPSGAGNLRLRWAFIPKR